MQQPPVWTPPPQGYGPQPPGNHAPPPSPPKKGVPGWVWVVGIFVGVPAVAAVGCVTCLAAGVAQRDASDTRKGPVREPAAVAPAATSAAEDPRLAEPPPPLAASAAEAPIELEKLKKDAAYLEMWNGKHDAELDAFLTALSTEQETQAARDGDAQIPNDVFRVVEKRKLTAAMFAVAKYRLMVGKYPEDFVRRFDAVLAARRGEPNRGMWKMGKGGGPPSDFTALAYLAHPGDAALLREFLVAKREGPFRWGWGPQAPRSRPYLSRERVALERLAALTTLSAGEASRLDELKASKLGDDPPMRVELPKLLGEYRSNEVRADDQFKGKVVEFSGIAGGVERGTLAGITLTIGTGQMFEHPEAHCFFDKSQTQRIKAINKGDRIRVRGRVEGLVMNVIVRNCELVP